MRMKRFLGIMLCSLAILLSGCSSVKEEISVTVYPIQYLVERIGGSFVDVNLITRDSTLIQAAKINSQYKKMLENSSALFYIRDLEPYYDIYASDIKDSGVNLIDLGSRGTFYKFERYNFSDSSQSRLALGSPYYEGDVFNNVDMYEVESMLWMDPISLIGSAGVIKEYLVNTYPAYEKEIIKNYEEVVADLTRLDVEYRDLKGQSANISFACMSPSFGMWQKSYGVKVYPITLSRYGALPSEEQLAIIKQRIINDNVEYIAYEANMTQEMKNLYDELKKELGLKEINLSNVSLRSKEEVAENKDYLTIMYENLATLESIAEY